MQGASGTYAFNGTDFYLQPTTGKWESRDDYGVDGNGHPIYAPVREFEIKWDLMSAYELSQLITQYNNVSNTGTFVIDLPKWGDATPVFYSYSGCTMQEPEVGTYFQGYVQDVSLIIMNIRT